MKLEELPIGAKIKEQQSGLRFLIAGQRILGYDGTVAVCDSIVRLGCFDAMEPDNPLKPRQDWGNNDYRFSNVRQWLNCGENDWFHPQIEFDAPPKAENIYDGDNPYYDSTGFLTGFSEAFLNAVRLSTITVLDKDGVVHHIKDRFFLLSRTEVGLGDEGGMAEGAALPLFSDFRYLAAAPTADAVVQATDQPYGLSQQREWCWWLRTPYVTRFCRSRLIYSGGVLTSNYTACGAVGIRPACVLDGNAVVEWDGRAPELILK